MPHPAPCRGPSRPLWPPRPPCAAHTAVSQHQLVQLMQMTLVPARYGAEYLLTLLAACIECTASVEMDRRFKHPAGVRSSEPENSQGVTCERGGEAPRSQGLGTTAVTPDSVVPPTELGSVPYGPTSTLLSAHPLPLCTQQPVSSSRRSGKPCNQLADSLRVCAHAAAAGRALHSCTACSALRRTLAGHGT